MRFKTICRLCDVSDSQGTWVPSFDWASFVDVHVVLVCEHKYNLRIWVRVVVATRECFGSCSKLRHRVLSELWFRKYFFASAWLLLHVYGLGDVVGSGIVLFQSGCF